MTETGLNIKKRRQELGMSAEELAETIGVNPTTIYRYEKGAIDKVSAETLGEIARALYTSPVKLMDWESEAVVPDIQIPLRNSQIGTFCAKLGGFIAGFIS